MHIGVLELQGDYALHHKIFSDLGIKSKGVKVPRDLDDLDGLVIPGGESTTISLLLDTYDLRNPIKEFSKEYPIMGTCAGLILMAKKIENECKVKPLGILDLIVNRNAYGRQIMSFKEPIKVGLNNRMISLDATLIRAPIITEVSQKIKIYGFLKNSPVAVMGGKHLGLTFHPELDNISLFHEMVFIPSSKFYWKNIGKIHAA